MYLGILSTVVNNGKKIVCNLPLKFNNFLCLNTENTIKINFAKKKYQGKNNIIDPKKK